MILSEMTRDFAKVISKNFANILSTISQPIHSASWNYLQNACGAMRRACCVAYALITSIKGALEAVLDISVGAVVSSGNVLYRTHIHTLIRTCRHTYARLSDVRERGVYLHADTHLSRHTYIRTWVDWLVGRKEVVCHSAVVNIFKHKVKHLQ